MGYNGEGEKGFHPLDWDSWVALAWSLRRVDGGPGL